MVDVRADLAAAHRRAWDDLASPGSWFTGAQRVELATTVVTAIDDAEPLPPWVAVTGTDRVPAQRVAPDVEHDAA